MNESEKSGTNTAKLYSCTMAEYRLTGWKAIQDVSLSKMCPRQDRGTWEGMCLLSETLLSFWIFQDYKLFFIFFYFFFKDYKLFNFLLASG